MLILGTAAFGFPYGVVNKIGTMSQAQVTQMVKIAWRLGIQEFDTAQMYGNSEEFLGNAFVYLGIQDQVKVITKLHPDLNYQNEVEIVRAIEDSLQKLKIRKLHGVLLHREYLIDSSIKETLYKIRTDYNFMKIIGVSVYQPEMAIKAINDPFFDIVQFPSCVLDRRFERAGVFELAEEKGKEIYLRNIFLQGLLLSDYCPISIVELEVEKLKQFSLDTGLTRCKIALGYLKIMAPQANLIFGAETQDQIRECVHSSSDFFYNDDIVLKIRELFSNVPDDVLIPKMWRKEI
jgi:aryl-alcohol dehydrogenase-like predicted oxidoreductase